ncbi:sensor domain-containing diguanylate cyclase [Paenibacillus favisporus]|uniref:sensor domain-containing diguanylate cyclase n=1 Tax=Paenibacillus favisporus TaxID=221028 RepID=UPI002DBD1EED|nr:sensor domain-containing diguanylate cyclase [Paenibacillus favisporus]MEC0177508.1 sensor domain-containing diguanylate cyclase [Paenibacillus favisporus]
MDNRLNYAPCGYVSITREGSVVDVNQTFLDMMEYREEDLIGRHIESIMSTANKLIFHSYFYPYIHLDGHVNELFISLKNGRGQAVPFILNGRRLEQDGAETIDCILVQMKKRLDYEQELRAAKKQMEEAYWKKDQALEELQRIYQEIEHKQAQLVEMNAVLVELSVTDKLTGLKNRRYFQEQLDSRLSGEPESGRPLSLAILDIDHFKQVNDTWGHPAGDEVLVRLGEVLTACSREGDIPARLGGEEFVLILPDTDAPEASERAERLRTAAEKADWPVGRITVSVGVATASAGDTEATLLKKADEALYASKTHGRNQSTHYNELNGRLP